MGTNNVQWQHEFAAMLPAIEKSLKRYFRCLDPASREEAIQEAIVSALLAYARLAERGRANLASAGSLSFYAARQVKCGRPAVGRMNCREPLARYCQLRNSCERESWIDELVEDKRASVADIVATRIDVRTWVATLPKRMKQIAADLAYGCTTSETAARHGVSAGRVSQLRTELKLSWDAFQGSIA